MHPKYFHRRRAAYNYIDMIFDSKDNGAFDFAVGHIYSLTVNKKPG